MKSKIIKLKYITIAVLLLSAIPDCLKAQPDTLPINSKLDAIAGPQSTRRWVNFRQGAKINPLTIFRDYKDAFELSANDDMRVRKTKRDAIGFTHYRYDQYYKNLRVVYGEYLVHQQLDSIVKSANGRLINGLNLGNTPSVSEQQGLNAALSFVAAKKYLWQNASMENELKRQAKNQSATYYPKGELVYAPGSNKGTYKAEDYRLAWHYDIYTDDPKVLAKSVYVDALTGQVIHSVDIGMVCSGGSGTSTFNGTVSISTQLSGGSYRSLNDCNPTAFYVYNCGGGGAVNNFYTDADNTWTDQSAVQAQFGVAQTYSYYKGQHSRESWNNAAGDMIAYNNANAGQNNACWGCTGNSTIFYAGNTSSPTDDWNTDDIMGHEFTHGVTQSEANLTYSNESGALNESFSDIFGEMVESWTEGNCDYLVGADRGAIRSFINPKAYGNPDTYLGTYWYTGSSDNGGVHTNSGVQNHWFYLLSEGGSGTNDLGQSYNVTGITRFKARLITYRALTEYLTSSSQYIDARKASLQAAWDLYGQCSQEIISVGDAWHAVGVESQSPAYSFNVCGTFSNGEFQQAISQLTAANGCTVTVNSASNTVYFTARDRVILYPGFDAVAGSKFVAYLEPCSSTRWENGGDGALPVIMSDPEKGIPVTQVQRNEATTGTTPTTASGIFVMPNPFRTTFDLSITAKKADKVQVVIYNSLGQKVQEKDDLNVIEGQNKITLDGSKFANGVYMAEIMMGGEKTTRRIVKM